MLFVGMVGGNTVAACGTELPPAARDASHDHDHFPDFDAAIAPLDSDTSDGSSDFDADDAESPDGAAPWAWNLPPGFPTPVVPESNPMSEAKVQLGRHLFYDTRLSDNQTQSCSSCHEQRRGFADRRVTALGSTGQIHPRNSMPLANVAYATTLTWGNPLLLSLEQQAPIPMFGREPVELGLAGREDILLTRLRAEPRYQALFPLAFPDDADPFSIASIVRALACFQRTLISGNSRYDRYTYRGDRDALTGPARRGLALFNSERLECFHCHNGFNFTDSVNYMGRGPLEIRFHNTGLYNVGGSGEYPAPNTGIHALTGRAEDMGRFRAQSLRNVEVTGPYMHDGSIATLEEVVDHYAAGGRTIAEGPNAGVGSASPNKSSFLIGFAITRPERADLVAFLQSLTDDEFLRDPRHSDPWLAPCEFCSQFTHDR